MVTLGGKGLMITFFLTRLPRSVPGVDMLTERLVSTIMDEVTAQVPTNSDKRGGSLERKSDETGPLVSSVLSSVNTTPSRRIHKHSQVGQQFFFTVAEPGT